MISRLFSGEVILTTCTIVVISGLIYQGVFSLLHGKEHAIFNKGKVVVVKK